MKKGQSGPANLQGMSARDAAKMMNVSERMVYMALELQRSGRGDLIAAVEAGGMSLHRALGLAKPARYGSRRDGCATLFRAWQAAAPAERAAFLRLVTPPDALES